MTSADSISRKMGNLACICYLGNFSLSVSVSVLLDFSLTVKAATLIFISECGSAIPSAKEG